jgi:hypothetical protein
VKYPHHNTAQEDPKQGAPHASPKPYPASHHEAVAVRSASLACPYSGKPASRF